MSPRAPYPPAPPTVIPVLQEVLEVQREREVLGTVRVRKEAHHDEVPVSTTCVRETVHTERVPINRAVDAMEPSRQTEDAWVIPVYEERWVRQLFLTEELHVRRLRETVEDAGDVRLRREEVVVERLDPETQTWVREALPPAV